MQGTPEYAQVFTTGQASIKKNKVVDLLKWRGCETMNRSQDYGHLRLWGTLLCGLFLAVVSIALLSTTSQVAKSESHFRPLLEPGVTRTKQGSRALALLPSVIETCRQRQILPWPYLAEVTAEWRKGNPAPPLPVAAH